MIVAGYQWDTKGYKWGLLMRETNEGCKWVIPMINSTIRYQWKTPKLDTNPEH